MWALCLITLAPRDCISDLPAEFANELLFFKDEIENSDPFGGKVQLNPIPHEIKNMIKKDATVLDRLRSQSSSLAVDKRIWTFPCFKPSQLNERAT